VADALHCEVARAAPLARLISDRTAGNPFFMGQLLRRLHEDGLIEFDPSSGSWWCRWRPSAPRA
jgi:predicted ATPase